MSEVRWAGNDEGHLFDGQARVAIIKKICLHGVVLWRSVTGEYTPDDRVLIGYFPSIELAARVTWRLWNQRGKPPEKQVLY